MMIVGFAFAGLAGLVHVYIFYLESIAWGSPAARAVFRTTPDEADSSRLFAFNQGFYNLFLAIMVVIGTCVYAAGHHDAGVSLVLAGVGSMLAAATVLYLASPSHRSAALRQGAAPAVAVVLIVVALLG